MAAIPYHVAEAFVKGEHARSGNFYTTGNEIWSYGQLLAFKAGGEIKLHNVNKCSVTTARHVNALLAVLER